MNRQWTDNRTHDSKRHNVIKSQITLNTGQRIVSRIPTILRRTSITELLFKIRKCAYIASADITDNTRVTYATRNRPMIQQYHCPTTVITNTKQFKVYPAFLTLSNLISLSTTRYYADNIQICHNSRRSRWSAKQFAENLIQSSATTKTHSNPPAPTNALHPLSPFNHPLAYLSIAFGMNSLRCFAWWKWERSYFYISTYACGVF